MSLEAALKRCAHRLSLVHHSGPLVSGPAGPRHGPRMMDKTSLAVVLGDSFFFHGVCRPALTAKDYFLLTRIQTGQHKVLGTCL